VGRQGQPSRSRARLQDDVHENVQSVDLDRIWNWLRLLGISA
jgi:hypothetical protein